MPIFEYRCDGCGHAFEALVRSSIQPACPHCGGTRAQKLLSVFATAASSGAAELPLPSGCGSCGHPGGPGACQFQ